MSYRTFLAGIVAAALIVAGVSLVLLGLMGKGGTPSQVVAPEPAVGAATPIPPPATPGPVASMIERVHVPRVNIDAPIVVLGVDKDGTMQSPSKPMDVGWYTFSGMPGQPRNIVMAGHVDYVNFGPAVFARLRDLLPGDEVQVDTNVGRFIYKVASVTAYNEATAPVAEIVGPTSSETLTLITCTGVFDTRVREYNQRLVVRAERVQT